MNVCLKEFAQLYVTTGVTEVDDFLNRSNPKLATDRFRRRTMEGGDVGGGEWQDLKSSIYQLLV